MVKTAKPSHKQCHKPVKNMKKAWELLQNPVKINVKKMFNTFLQHN